MTEQHGDVSPAFVLSAVKLPLRLTLHLADESDSLSQSLADAARVVREADGAVELRPVSVERRADLDVPRLTLERDGCGDVHYLARPVGPEAAPFVELVAGELVRPPEPLGRPLATLGDPARLTVFVAEACPHCPTAVRAALALAAASPAVEVEVVDAQRFPARSAELGVRSAPTVVLDGGLARTGTCAVGDLAADVLARGEEGFEARVFASLVESGRFVPAVRRVVHGGGAAQLLACWETSTTSLRIALLLLVEKILAADPRALHGIVPGLVAVARTPDAALRGDTTDLLGRFADHPAAREALERLCRDPHPDVAEIAAEGLGTG